jgi:hypothetical protein
MLTMKLHCLQEIPPFDLVEQGDEGDWDTVGEPAGGSHNPAPTMEELVAQLKRQPPVAEGSTEAQEKAPAEAGLVDIASILGAPTVTVVRSSL